MEVNHPILLVCRLSEDRSILLVVLGQLDQRTASDGLPIAFLVCTHTVSYAI